MVSGLKRMGWRHREDILTLCGRAGVWRGNEMRFAAVWTLFDSMILLGS